MPERICLASLHPRVLSGEIDSLTGLARALVDRGHQVRLVAPFDTSRLLRSNLTALDQGPTRFIPAARAMLGTLPRIREAALGSDLVHLALPSPAFTWVADLLQASISTPLVVGFEGQLVQARELLAARHRRAARSYLPLWGLNNHALGRLSAHRPSAYVVSSRYQADELRQLGTPAERIAVVSNLVDDTKLVRSEPRLARRFLGLPSRVPLIGYVGHFNDVKGVDVLATAFADVLAQQPAARLVLAWSGQGNPDPVRRPLQAVASRVTWLGKVSVGTFLSAVDLLVLPYRSTAGQELFPSLVLESLLAGCPLVTTDLPLLQEVVSLGPVASTCPPEQPVALAETIVALLRSEERRRTMSEAQQRVARRFFDPSVLVRQYEALYESIPGASVSFARAA